MANNPKLLSYIEDKIKALIETRVQKLSELEVDDALSDTSENPVQNKVINTALGTKVDKVPGKGLSTNDYTTAEKNKLAGIEADATRVLVDSALSSTSTNPVQNNAIYTALQGKVDTESGKGLSTNDFTTAEKQKLAGIAAGATAVTVDSALSSASTNPVQNKAIKTELDNRISPSVSIKFFSAPGNGGTATIPVRSSYRGILLCAAIAINAQGIYSFGANSSGRTSVRALIDASGLAFETATNALNLTNNSETYVSVIMIET